jgi:hypothetical protein
MAYARLKILLADRRQAQALAGKRPASLRAQKSGLSAFGISETDASNAMLFSAQMASSIAPARVRR